MRFFFLLSNVLHALLSHELKRCIFWSLSFSGVGLEPDLIFFVLRLRRPFLLLPTGLIFLALSIYVPPPCVFGLERNIFFFFCSPFFFVGYRLYVNVPPLFGVSAPMSRLVLSRTETPGFPFFVWVGSGEATRLPHSRP